MKLVSELSRGVITGRFFHGWRRKAGVLMLGLALLAENTWVWSLVGKDQFILFVTSGQVLELISAEGNFYAGWHEQMGEVRPRYFHGFRNGHWHFEADAFQVFPLKFDRMGWETRRRTEVFGLTSLTTINNSPQERMKSTVYLIPYAALVISFIFGAAFLFLVKQTTSDPVAVLQDCRDHAARFSYSGRGFVAR